MGAYRPWRNMRSAGGWLMILLATAANADPLTIRQIQSNTSDGDLSIFDGAIVDCAGGVCIAKSDRFLPRLILVDPNSSDGWGGVQVRDWTFGDLYDHVQIGDWVTLSNVAVEEVARTTILQYKPENGAAFAVTSQHNPLPPAVTLTPADIPAPIYDPDTDGWYVPNHDAEPYESMRLIVHDVTVTEMDLGKAVDNYNIRDQAGHDAWAADYMNADIDPSGYHPFVSVGQGFCGLRGVLEQYTNLADGWDYYQIVTFSSADLAICGDADHDGDVDLSDLSLLLAHYGTPSGATFEDGDFDDDGDVDLSDLAILLSAYGESVP